MRSDRLLDLVALLRAHERLTSAQLAERLGVSRRTVLRDLDTLSLSGVPVYAEHGRGGGFSMLPGYRPETAGLTPAELQALVLPGGAVAADAIGLGPEHRSARRKLELALSDDAARGLGAVFDGLLVVPEGWGDPDPTPAAVPQLAPAIAGRELVDIDYRARGQAVRTRRVKPIGLVLAARTWYLLAQREDGEHRTYRADRISRVAPQGRHFRPELGLQDAWQRARASFRTPEGTAFRLRTPRDHLPVIAYLISLVGRIIETTEVGDDVVEVGATTARLTDTAALLTGIPTMAELLGPPELIAAVVQASRANLHRYAVDG